LTDSITPTRSRTQLYAIILFHQVITALAFPVARLGLLEINPYVFAFFRFAISSVFYILVISATPWRISIPGRDYLRIFIVGLVLIPGNQVMYLVGQSMTTASHSSLLFATMPIFVYILALLFLGERPSSRRFAGILIAMIGVYIILAGGRVRFGMETLRGDLIVLAAVIAWAVGTIMVKPLAIKYGAFRVVGLALTFGSAVYLPYGLYRTIDYDLTGISPSGWLSIGYMALVVSGLAYFLWYWVLKYMEASRIAVLQNIQPIIATAVAAVMLGEPVGKSLVAGGLIVIGGVILTEIK
jgi:drug/metabolite transporter (DMT)-like permease